jgi:hypothetical protein
VEAANAAIMKGLVKFPYACIHGSNDLVVDVEGSIMLHEYSSGARLSPISMSSDSMSCSHRSASNKNSSRSLAPKIRKDLFIVEGGMHDLFGAPQTPQVLDYVINWIDDGFSSAV